VLNNQGKIKLFQQVKLGSNRLDFYINISLTVLMHLLFIEIRCNIYMTCGSSFGHKRSMLGKVSLEKEA